MGVVIGLLGLLVVGAFFASAILVIVLGARWRASWAPPSCAACRYDLSSLRAGEVSACPECGADLTGPRGVSFMRRRASWPIIGTGITLLVLPLVAGLLQVVLGTMGATAAAGGGPAGLASTSTGDIIATRIPAEHAQPWVWRELESRAVDGSMTAEQADAAVAALAAAIDADPSSTPPARSWSEDFIRTAQARGLLGEASLVRLGAAMRKPRPTLGSIARVRSGDATIGLEVETGIDPFAREAPVGVAWRVNAVRVAGIALPHETVRASEHDWSGTVRADLGAGEHPLEVDFGYVLLSESTMHGRVLGDVPLDTWQTPFARHTVTLRGTVVVADADAVLVRPVSDPALADSVRAHLRVGPIMVERDRRGQLRLVPGVQIADGFPLVAAAFDVAFEHEGRRVELGMVGSVPMAGRWSTHSMYPEFFPEGVTSVRVVFTPNLAALEHHAGVSEAWGEPVVFEDVPVVWRDEPGSR